MFLSRTTGWAMVRDSLTFFRPGKKTRESLRGRRPVCDDVIGTRGKEVALPSSPALVPLLAPLIKSGWLLFLLSGPVKIGIPLHAPSAHTEASSS